MHGRPPAFGGPDGRAYSVSPFVDDDPDPAGRYGAALLFLRWTEGGDRVEGHLETDYVAFGETPGAALDAVRALTLAEVKAQLDACVARHARRDP